MSKVGEFLKKKDIEISAKRYGVDALGAMAQGLFASLLIGTIINTIGSLFHIPFLVNPIATVAGVDYTVGGLCSTMSGPAMAAAIGYALKAPPLVLFSLITVGFSANALGGAGGPLAVLIIAIVAAEFGKLVSKSTKVDILVKGTMLPAWRKPPLIGLITIKENSASVRPKTALLGVGRLYIGEISCILYTCKSFS